MITFTRREYEKSTSEDWYIGHKLSLLHSGRNMRAF